MRKTLLDTDILSEVMKGKSRNVLLRADEYNEHFERIRRIGYEMTIEDWRM